jgi:CDP-4-dehydro-6-deoxyglucose reductase
MQRITVVPEGVTIDAGDDETILEALYRNGYAYKIGCRRGGCAICMVDLLDGDVEYNRTVASTVLSEEDKDAGACLSCRAVPLTDVTVQLRKDTLRRVNPFFTAPAPARTG